MAVQSGIANSAFQAPAFALDCFRSPFSIGIFFGVVATALCLIRHRWQKQISARQPLTR